MVLAGDAEDPSNAAGAASVLGRALMQPENHGDSEVWPRAAVSGAEWASIEPDVTTFNITTTPDQISAAILRLSLIVAEPVWNRTLVMRSLQLEAEADREVPPDAWTQDFDVLQARSGLPVSPDTPLNPPDRDALKAFYRRAYTPDRMVLAVVGDVDAAAVTNQAASVFTAPVSPSARFTPRKPRPILSKPDNPTGSYAFVGVQAPPATAKDAAAMEVLAAALGMGKTSNVFEQLREREGKGYESGAVYPRRFTDSVLALYALAPGHAAERRQDLLAVWKLAGKPPKGGWDTARAGAAHAYAAQHQTARDRAYWLAFWELSGQGAAHDAAFATALRTASEESLATAARRYLAATPVSVP